MEDLSAFLRGLFRLRFIIDYANYMEDLSSSMKINLIQMILLAP